MKYFELKVHIGACMTGGFAPVYLVHGDDDWLCSEALKAFKEILSPDYLDFNYSSFEGEDALGDALAALDTFPVFDEHRVVVLTLRQPIGEASLAMLKDYIASPMSGSVLVIDADDAVAKAIKLKGIEDVGCDSLKDDDLRAEVAKLLRRPPAKQMSPSAVEELIRRTAGSMARIASEITKLKAYSDTEISLGDVKDMVTEDLDFQYYALADAVSTKNANEALKILNFFEINGVRSVTLLNNMYEKYRRLLHLSLNRSRTNDEMAVLLGVKPGAIHFMKRTLENYSQVRLKKSVDYLHRKQFDIVSGRCSEQNAAHEAVLELLNI